MPAGVRIELTTDDKALRAALGRMIAVIANPTPVMDEIGQRLVTSVIHRFETERGPDGTPWRKSARAKRDSGQTLTDTGRLRASITHRAGRDEVLVGTNVVYAAIHQFGGRTPARTIRPKRKKALYWPGARHPVKQVRHPGSTVPARPFLGIDAIDRGVILDVIRRRIDEAVA